MSRMFFLTLSKELGFHLTFRAHSDTETEEELLLRLSKGEARMPVKWEKFKDHIEKIEVKEVEY